MRRMISSSPLAVGRWPWKAFGQRRTDLFDPGRAKNSAAFVFTTFREPPTLGLVQGGRYAIVRSGEADGLPEAFYEFSRWLLFHNAAGAGVL